MIPKSDERLSAEHPCRDPDSESGFDHDWKYVRDWYGDPGVINGTADCSFWRCKRCGEEKTDGAPIDWEPDDDYPEV
jgi:hypothetical protein